MMDEKVGMLYIYGEKFPLTKKPFRVGTAEFCDLQFNHPSLSHYHARIDWVNVGFLILDLNSQNKTSVNGNVLKKYAPTTVSDLAIIKFGKVTGLLMVDNKQRVAMERKLSQTPHKTLHRRVEYKIPRAKTDQVTNGFEKFLRCDIVATLSPKRRYSEFNESALDIIIKRIEISERKPR